MKKVLRPAAAAAALALAPGCYGYHRGGEIFAAMAGTAIVTAAIVSASQPPPPRVVYAPPPRPGYSWQPGYWTKEHGDWVWMEGHWVACERDRVWVPSHWERAPDGYWELVPGYWARA